MAASASPTCKAWAITRAGLPRSALSLQTEHPVPAFPPALPLPKAAPKPEEWILLRVSYAALNPSDIYFMNLVPAFLRSSAKPNVPCSDLVGTVDDVWAPTASDANPPRFRKGDAAVAFLDPMLMLQTGAGGLAGTVAIPARLAVRVPEGKTHRDAAGLLLTACTVLKQVEETGLKAGQRVLVIGASGGVGTMAVQLAREAVGSEGFVAGVCSGRNVDLVKGLGADEVIDYTQYKNLPEELAKRYGEKPFDAIIDDFGNQDVYKHCAKYLKPQGMYNAVCLHASSFSRLHVIRAFMHVGLNILWPKAKWLGGTGRTWKMVQVMPEQTLMERAVKLFGEGKLKVVVDSEWPLEKALEAFDMLMSGRARGKLVINVDGGHAE